MDYTAIAEMDFTAFKTFLAVEASDGASGVWSELDRNALRYAAHVVCGVKYRPPAGLEQEEVPALELLANEPEYGATVVGLTSCTDEGICHIQVLGLDGWTHNIIAGSHTSVPADKPVVLLAGRVPDSRLELYRAWYEAIKATALKRTGEQRHARAGGGGHQKTPAFIDAIVRKAIEHAQAGVPVPTPKEAEPDPALFHVAPKGGFTDVGRHTGGEARDTDLALLVARVHHAMSVCVPPAPHPDQTCAYLMVLFYLWRAESMTTALFPEASAHPPGSPGDTPGAQPTIDHAMLALLAASRRAEPLVLTGLWVRAMADVRARCERIRVLLEEGQSASTACIAERHTLHPVMPDAAFLSTHPSPPLNVSNAVSPGEAMSDIEAAKKRAMANIGWVAHLGGGGLSDAQRASKQMDERIAVLGGMAADAARCSFLADVEDLVFSLCMELPLTETEDARPTCTDVPALIAVVDAYRLQARAYLASDAAKALSRTAARSREVLVVWASYAMIFQAAWHHHPQLQSFAVAADCQDLRHLVLESKRHWDVLLHVSSYLQLHAPNEGSLPVFSGRTDEVAGTHALAYAVAAHTPSLQEIWQTEKAKMDGRVRERWSKVEEKKHRCGQLHADRASLEDKLNRTAKQRDALEYRSRQWHDYDAEVRALWAKISDVSRQLDAAGQPPPDLFLPLPEANHEGLRAVFFCHMPDTLQALARFSFEAYDVLSGGAAPSNGTAPQARPEVGLSPGASSPPRSEPFLDYHDGHAPVRKAERGSRLELFGPKQPPQAPGHSSYVESLSSDHDGVWSPPHARLEWRWDGGSLRRGSATPAGAYHNPFAAQESELVVRYTEVLPAVPGDGLHALQWAVLQPGCERVPLERGNAPVAAQDKRTPWCTKPEFLAFGALRAYPLQQLRKIAALLNDEALPLVHPGVQTLIQQAVYHVGELEPRTGVLASRGDGADGSIRATDGRDATTGGVTSSVARSVRMMWKQDLTDGTLLDELANLLERLSTQLADSPRRHVALLLLGPLAAFFGEWDGPAGARCRAAARKFSVIAKYWGDALEPQLVALEDACCPADAAVLRHKQHLYFATAIACYGAISDSTSADAAGLLELRVRMHHTQPLLGDANGRPTRVGERDAFLHNLAKLTSVNAARRVMAARAADLITLLHAAPDSITRAVHCVLPRLSATLSWSPWETVGTAPACKVSCFEAVAPGNQLITVNVLTGAVLVNGLPPNFLPSTIISHPLYSAVFGDRNCSVVTAASDTMETAQPLAGRHYSFRRLADADTLTIYEMDPSSPVHRPATDGSRSDRASPETLPVRYRLLDCATPAELLRWGKALSNRLMYLHSHWLTHDLPASAGASVVLFRPRSYSQRTVQFLAVGDGASTRIFAVPGEKAHFPPDRLVAEANAGLLDRLLQAPLPAPYSGVLGVLKKFERAALIESYATSDGTLAFVLPRFGRRFEVRPAADTPVMSSTATLVEGGPPPSAHLVSADYDGYRLNDCQLLRSALLGFQRYLLLEAISPEFPDKMDQPRYCLVTPVGEVEQRHDVASATVDVFMPNEFSAHIDTYVYDFHHRTGHLVARDITSRLHLAALHAATSTLLPEPAQQMTGTEQALELVRRCWVNRPLRPAQTTALCNITRFCAYAPSLRMLCDELYMSSQQLAWLHSSGGSTSEARVPGSDATGSCDAVSAYTLAAPLGPRNSRLALSTMEEARCSGGAQAWSPPGSTPLPATIAPGGWLRWHAEAVRTLEVYPLEASAVSHSIVSETEAALCALTVPKDDRAGWDAPFPLENEAGLDMHIAKSMLDELRDSWDAHQRSPEYRLAKPRAIVCGAVREMHAKASAARQRLEESLVSCIGRLPTAAEALPAATPSAGQTVDERGGRRPGEGETASSPSSLRCTAFRIRRAANDAPVVAFWDLVRASWQPLTLLHFNPCLSHASIGRLQQSCNVLMQLCVLEDRLQRVRRMADMSEEAPDDADEARLVRELRVHRTWDPQQHPQWLAFEVEGGIQIRPEQHALLRELAEGKDGAIKQLNMGLGKTRVLVPCLLLLWAQDAEASVWALPSPLAFGLAASSSTTAVVGTGAPSSTGDTRALRGARSDRTIRLYFLTQLLDEGFDALHKSLTASVLRRRLFRMPFHRDVELNEDRMRAMHNTLLFCRRSGGMLIQAPEHQLSLQLKFHELVQSQPASASSLPSPGLSRVLQQLTKMFDLAYQDIYDESDEVLHHRRQLVYAVGLKRELPAGSSRWCAASALLHLARVLEPSGRPPPGDAGAERLSLTARSNVCTWDSQGAGAHAWEGLRLLPGQPLESSLSAWQEGLVRSLLSAPPRPLRWLSEAGRQHDAITAAVLDVSLAAEERLPREGIALEHYADILALRGLLGHGVLAHCLQKRHRVDYGIARGRRDAKRLAVPFVAADTPSARSEFAQPDCALVFTTLAYYYDGLSLGELREALQMLMRHGKVAQERTYAEWFRLSAPSIADDSVRASINHVSKLDLSNDAQLSVLHDAYSHNMLVVDFWLHNCVFTQESSVFPFRLLASPWTLTSAAPARCGFSGTNDDAMLLPSNVKQRPSDDLSLRGTNGRMLELLGKAEYACLLEPVLAAAAAPECMAAAPGSSDCATPARSTDPGEAHEVEHPSRAGAIVDFALSRSADALIDVGALMAGMSNRDVGALVTERLRAAPSALRSRYKGVCFFERDPLYRCWVVRDIVTGMTMPLKSSPIPEKECFSFYDQFQCRGADLRLAKKALGVLTLAPRTRKSELMQGAGRMRGLEFGQTLLVLAPPEVHAMLLRRASPAPANDSLVPPIAAQPLGSALARVATMRDVLGFVMANSSEAVAKGLSQWAYQGIHLASTHGVTPAACLNDHVDLEHLYAGSGTLQPISAVMPRIMHSMMRRRHDLAPTPALREPLAGSQESCALDAVKAAMDAFGADIRTRGSGDVAADEECERELEKEVEEEEEQEMEVTAAEPLAEIDSIVGFGELCRSSSPAELLARTPGLCARPLHEWIAELLPAITEIRFQATGVWATSNFVRTVKQRPGVHRSGHGPSDANGLAQFLRPIDLVLLFPTTRTLLLLSEREGDALLRLYWAACVNAGNATEPHVISAPRLVNFAFLRRAADEAAANPPAPASAALACPSVVTCFPALQLPPSVSVCLSHASIAAAQLFAGETMFGMPDADAAVMARAVSASRVSDSAAVVVHAGMDTSGHPRPSERLRALRAMLPSSQAADAAYDLVTWRGMHYLYERSHLEEVCDKARAEVGLAVEDAGSVEPLHAVDVAAAPPTEAATPAVFVPPSAAAVNSSTAVLPPSERERQRQQDAV